MSNTKLISVVFINTEKQSVSNIQIEPTLDVYCAKLNVTSVTTAGQFDNGDLIIVDDLGIYAAKPKFFVIDENGYGPLAGNAIIVGAANGINTNSVSRAETLTVTFYASSMIDVGPPGNRDGGIIAEDCGCVYNWDDGSYNTQCAEHKQKSLGNCKFCGREYPRPPFHRGVIQSEMRSKFCSYRCADRWQG